MRIKLLIITIFSIIAFSNISKADGPFGVEMGANISEYGCTSIDAAPGRYMCNNVKRPHPDFEAYVVMYHPLTGICWVKGAGKTINTNSFGTSLIDLTDDIANQISSNYGPGEKSDGLMSGSIWDDSDDWMMGLFKDERYYFYQWKSKKLKNNLSSIFVGAIALDTGRGFISAEFRFTNYEKCASIIDNEKSKSF